MTLKNKTDENGNPLTYWGGLSKNKSVLEDTKETLEEASENYVENFAMSVKSARKIGFIDGAKWQAERSYSEEDVISILEFARLNYYDTGARWHQEPDTDLTSQELIKKYYE